MEHPSDFTRSNDSAIDDRPAALYRIYSGNGELLYVGMTVNVFSRIEHHQSGKPWWTFVRTITVTPYSDRRAAERAERLAIRAESPTWNDQIREVPRKPRKQSRVNLATARAHLAECDTNAVAVAEARLGLANMNPREIREKAGISQMLMAEKIGVSAAALCRQEAGTRQPRAETAVRWHAELRLLQKHLAAIPNDRGQA